MINRRNFALATAGTLCSSAFVPAWAQAQAYPTRPVNMVVGYSAGGPTDVFIRAVGERLADEWKQPIVVDNRPGASEIIAAQYVARAPADGYTLFVSTEVPLTMNQYMVEKLPYDPVKNFDPVSLLLSCPLTLVVNPALNVNTLREFIALARSRAATRPLAYGSAGQGASNHLAMAMLAKQEGLQLTHAPYKGIAPLLTDILSGQVEAGWVGVSAAVPYVKEGRVKALVVGAPARIPALPQVAAFTQAETGVTPVQADFVFTLVAPAGTPLAIRERLAASVKKVLADPQFREKNVNPFGYVVTAGTPAELAQYLDKDRMAQAARIKTAGVGIN